MKKRITERELERMFDDSLDESIPEVCIGSLTYSPSDVLKNVDPTAYRCEIANFADSIMDEYWIEGFSPDDEDPDLNNEEEV